MAVRQFPQVIVGIDRSPSGQAALRVAVAEAVRRGVPLHAVRVRPLWYGAADDFRYIDAAFLEAVGDRPDRVDLRNTILAPPIAAALTARAGHPGDVLVLGARNRGRRRWWHRIWHRSTVRNSLRHARCPVLIVAARNESDPLAGTARGSGDGPL
jgi:nucleotide-binding universal stress UspA family protein